MSVQLRRRTVKLTLPLMPPKFQRGDKRNYVRWHVWVEAVKALAAFYKSPRAQRRPRP
ncbi:MAG: hypothetical protein LAO77_23145 [Acidobacteriia bacterium]|nr:hypothetical protein [Terriglobia bacterium]